MEPTVTDADIVLGFIDPDNFLGGGMKLNRDKAAQAIHDRIAAPLGLTVEEAALHIKQKVDSNIGLRIAHEIGAQGRKAEDFALLAYGGAGPTHCCGYAQALGVGRIITFPYSAVFSAFGSSTADVVHTYTHTELLTVYTKADGIRTTEAAKIDAIVEGLKAKAVHDIRGEGFSGDQVTFELDLIVAAGSGAAQLVHAPGLHFAGELDLLAVCRAFLPEADEIVFDTFMLRVRGSVPHWEMQAEDDAGADAQQALKGERPVYWPGGFQDTRVYGYDKLRAGNAVSGPAVVESDSTTYVLPRGAMLTLDRYRNGIIETATERGAR
jgi:N-methylhydantoinase A/acetophenone carboxylase